MKLMGVLARSIDQLYRSNDRARIYPPTGKFGTLNLRTFTPELLQHTAIFQGRSVAGDLLTRRQISQQAAHDLARSGLG
jgi:hypothetical protein